MHSVTQLIICPFCYLSELYHLIHLSVFFAENRIFSLINLPHLQHSTTSPYSHPPANMLSFLLILFLTLSLSLFKIKICCFLLSIVLPLHILTLHTFFFILIITLLLFQSMSSSIFLAIILTFTPPYLLLLSSLFTLLPFLHSFLYLFSLQPLSFLPLPLTPCSPPLSLFFLFITIHIPTSLSSHSTPTQFSTACSFQSLQDVVIPRLAGMALANNSVSNETKKTDIALQLFEAYSAMSCCFINDQLVQEAMLPGLRYLRQDLAQIAPEREEVITSMIKEYEAKVDASKSLERSPSLSGSPATGGSTEDVRARVMSRIKDTTSKAHIPNIFTRKK
ncbi:unnamed protein product [Acanthosepion pharaonis]|uniref:Uncharacterized protein n=1 Tax=Acanthosepion pharaonis TaxID=158019 RepID=A0A812C2W1_ACAPH|nr:unnamed protein product [Sepia pharaonis]